MNLSQKEISYFIHCSEEIITSEAFRSMKDFIQHGSTSCLEHSLAVAYYSYYLCQRLNLSVDDRSMIRGALLHDLFLYDWHYKADRKGLHGFTHSKAALQNAQDLFTLNKKEKDIIVKHMWPLTIIPPRYKEALIVCIVDKYCSTAETFGLRLFKNLWI